MHIEKKSNLVFSLTLSGYELAALISLARWAVEGAEGELTPEAVSQLEQIVSSYDKAAEKLAESESK